MVVYILQNFSHWYSSDYSKIKCIVSTIKYISFESVHYAININIVTFFMICSNFIICLYRCITNLNQLNYFFL